MRAFAAILFTVLASSCATQQAGAPSASSVCRTPMPIELRLRRVQARIALAYQHGPALTAEEAALMDRLQACRVVGDGCAHEWAAAEAAGVPARDRIGGARYDIPSLTRRAAAMPLGGERTNLLVVAMLTAEAAANALQGHDPATSDDVIAMNLVTADFHQAIVCDAADLAAGRRAGMPNDPSAAIPNGP